MAGDERAALDGCRHAPSVEACSACRRAPVFVKHSSGRSKGNPCRMSTPSLTRVLSEHHRAIANTTGDILIPRASRLAVERKVAFRLQVSSISRGIEARVGE